MSELINTKLDSQPVLARLAQIRRDIDDLSPAMLAIGEILTESTKQRFSDSTAPDGSRWKPNAPATVLATLARISGAYSKKTGKLTKKGSTAVMGKKPLVATGILQDTISYNLINGGDGVEIGTNRFAGEWDGGAAVHQFGSKDGKIPARPFLGISTDDETDILAILANFGSQAIG